MFVKGMEGTLMEASESESTRFKYTVWFDYTRVGINSIQEGTMLAAPNFASDQHAERFSVLEVVTVLPTHYAIEGGAGGYPGFVVEAARSASEDWEQEDESTQDTTKIRVVAIPTNLEIVEPKAGKATIDSESNIAKVGCKVRILDTEYSNLVANNGIDEKNERNLTTIGTLARDDKVNVLLRIDELYRTHFAIFGFTGVGKSNLLSTVVAKVFADADDPLKLVFFDLMSEYTVLLIDQLLDAEINAKVLAIGRHTLPEGVFKYINETNGAPGLDEATKQLARYTLRPKALAGKRAQIDAALRRLLEQKRVKYFNESQSMTVWDLWFTSSITWAKERRDAKRTQRQTIIKNVLKISCRGDYKATRFTPELAKKVREAFESELQKADAKEFAQDFANHLAKLEELERATAESLAASVTLKDLVNDLNDPNRRSLWVIQAHNPHDMRAFSKHLGEAIYEQRRQQGLIDPLVSFIFDEADEFIRRDAKEGTSYAESAEIAQTLARRGRKFGLGIGIATQRIRYLDTNIMAQPHTYFISKLPRLTDRQAVSEAFGMSDELLNQTFKFRKGHWLLMSHDATGLEAIPIPIKTPDANRRISDYLDKQQDSAPSHRSPPITPMPSLLQNA